MKFSFLHVAFYLPAALAIWPRPRNLTTGNTPIRLASDFSIKFSHIPKIPQDLQDAVSRTRKFLTTDQLQILLPDRGASLSDIIRSARTLPSLTISLSNPSSQLKSISEDAVAGLGVTDESYTLLIPTTGGAILNAKTALGLLRGLATFEQLWFYLDRMIYTLQAPIQIEDSPVYVN